MTTPLGDPYRKIHAGEPFRFPGTLYNELLDMLRWWKTQQGVSKGVAVVPVPLRVRNATGAAIGQFAVLEIGDPSILPEDDADEFAARVIFNGTTPTGSDSICVIAQRPGEDDEVVPAILRGVSVAKVVVNDTDHQYAAPIVDDNTQLESVQSGQYRILWIDDQGGDNEWALVEAILLPTESLEVMTCLSMVMSGTTLVDLQYELQTIHLPVGSVVPNSKRCRLTRTDCCTSGSGGGGTVNCGDLNISTHLKATISNAVWDHGGSPCFFNYTPPEIDLYYTAGGWEGTSADLYVPPASGDFTIRMRLECHGELFLLLMGCQAGVGYSGPTAFSTSIVAAPLSILFHMPKSSGPANCGSCTFDVTITDTTIGGGGTGEGGDYCCPEGLPATLYLHLTNVSGCDDWDGVTATLPYDADGIPATGGIGCWTGEATAGGRTCAFTAWCVAPAPGGTCDNFYLLVTFGGAGPGTGPSGSCACDPLSIPFSLDGTSLTGNPADSATALLTASA